MNSKLRRFLHAALFTLLAAGTLVALFYAEEDWRGARVWNATKRDLKARGESVDPANFIPTPVPDDQNLAMAPLFARLFRYKVDPKTHLLTFNPDYELNNDTFKTWRELPWGPPRKPIVHPPSYNNHGDWTTGHMSEFSEVQAYYHQGPGFSQAPSPNPADDVLLGLTHFAPQLDEMAQAAQERPRSRFPVNWTHRPAWGIRLSHYSYLQLLTNSLRLRATAELAVGQTAAAHRDVDLTFRLRQSTENEPNIIATLVDAACLRVMMQPIWEGLAARRWTAAELDDLRDHLLSVNILREYQQAMRAERASYQAKWPEDLPDPAQAHDLAKELPSTSGDDPPLSPWDRRLWPLLPYWPRGWYEQNAAIASRYLQTDWIDLVDPANRRMNFARNLATAQVMKHIPASPYTLLVRISLPVFSSITNKYMQTQTILDQAATACALEKYYLDHHAYPDTLPTLVPSYLDRVPNDIIDNAPMRYRLTADGRYQLYSIGLDGHDDGGIIAWLPDRNWRRDMPPPPNGREHTCPSPDRFHGDWVWQYAPAEPPDPPASTSRLPSLR